MARECSSRESKQSMRHKQHTRTYSSASMDVLRRNAQYKIGAWQVVCRPGTEECHPVFQIELPAESSTAYLKMAVLTRSSWFSCESSLLLLCGLHACTATRSRAQHVNNNEKRESILVNVYESKATRGQVVKKQRLSKAKLLCHSARHDVAEALIGVQTQPRCLIPRCQRQVLRLLLLVHCSLHTNNNGVVVSGCGRGCE